MVMLVAAGEALAADGLEDGRRATDRNAMLTGESAPRRRCRRWVHAGTINLRDPLPCPDHRDGGDTAIAEIARLMDEAGQSRSYLCAHRRSRGAALCAWLSTRWRCVSFAGWMIAGAGLHQSLTDRDCGADHHLPLRHRVWLSPPRRSSRRVR